MKGLNKRHAKGKVGNNSLKRPYKANLSTIAAKTILPPNGDSTCAFSNQELNPYIGVLTPKAIIIPINKHTCRNKSKFILSKTSKSVLPEIEPIVRIDNNINKELAKVYKNK